MDTKLQHLLIGAFLHDIGKFMQRAEVEISSQTDSFMSSAGPSKDGRSTHYHVKWTSEFFETYLGDIGIPPSDSLDDSAAHLAFKHHNPSTPLQWVVAEADRLSSGMERREQMYEKDAHKRKRLVPLRSLLSLDESPTNPKAKCPLSKLTSTNDSCYPMLGDDANEWLVPEYKALWNQFLHDWRNRKANGIHAILAHLDALFERYVWCVPASTIEVIPDNSLYEHSRSVAALSSCLYSYHYQNQSLSDENSIKNRSLDKYLLVAGDLSGIQRYIFAIAHAGGGKVAKRLRARSFYISRIPLILAIQILDDLGLPHLNLILSAGGKFHLLLPNTQQTHTVLQNHEKRCQEWLHQNLQGELSLNLASVIITGDDFMQKRVGDTFSALADALAVKKHQPLHSYLIQDGNWRQNRFVMSDAKIKTENFSGYYEIPSHYDEEHLGTRLTKSECLGIYRNEDQGLYPVLGWSFSVAERSSDLDRGYDFIVSFKKQAVESIYFHDVPVYYEYRASHIPALERDEIDEFKKNNPEEEILENVPIPFTAIAKQSTGRIALAYLKADVDSLGLILRKGMDWSETRWTLSKIATFSRSLEFFFAGRVNNLLYEDEFKMIYTVFSGGDDVFLIGPWDVIHAFANRLQQEWTRYTAGNPNLTLSVGINLTRPLMPVWAAAEQVEEAEKKAKHESSENGKTPKNQVCSFNHLIRWNEYDFVLTEIERLNAWLIDKKITSSFLRNLIYFAELAERFRKENFVEGLRYLPLLSYQVSRNINDEAIRVWAEQLKDMNGDMIRHIGYIANYCLNLNRRS